jgi:uncharacterized protein (DUF362 family)
MAMKADKTRREFLRDAGLLAGGAAAAASAPTWGAETPKHDVVVVSGENPAAMVKKAVAELGGMKRFVSRGDVVVVKPNIGFERRPEHGALTHPDVLTAVIEMVFEAGAKEVKVFDRTVMDPKTCYEMSGLPAAAKAAGAKVYHSSELKTTAIDIPKGRHLKKDALHTIALECDCYINLPVPKHHHASQLTMSMKNHMGLTAGDRRFWHKNIHQSIADFATVFKADLNILDAYRVVYKNGPRGGSPTDVKYPKKCAAGINQASLDAYGATIHGKKPNEIRYLDMAGKMGVGEIDLDKLKIHEVSV